MNDLRVEIADITFIAELSGESDQEVCMVWAGVSVSVLGGEIGLRPHFETGEDFEIWLTAAQARELIQALKEAIAKIE